MANDGFALFLRFTSIFRLYLKDLLENQFPYIVVYLYLQDKFSFHLE